MPALFHFITSCHTHIAREAKESDFRDFQPLIHSLLPMGTLSVRLLQIPAVGRGVSKITRCKHYLPCHCLPVHENNQLFLRPCTWLSISSPPIGGVRCLPGVDEKGHPAPLFPTQTKKKHHPIRLRSASGEREKKPRPFGL